MKYIVFAFAAAMGTNTFASTTTCMSYSNSDYQLELTQDQSGRITTVDLYNIDWGGKNYDDSQSVTQIASDEYQVTTPWKHELGFPVGSRLEVVQHSHRIESVTVISSGSAATSYGACY